MAVPQSVTVCRAPPCSQVSKKSDESIAAPEHPMLASLTGIATLAGPTRILDTTKMPQTLFVTHLDGPDSDPVEKWNPTWADIETAIRRLDGHTCTLVGLSIGEAPLPHMSIGGGEGGKYIVYCTPDNQTFYNLINPKAASQKVMLVAGGQLGDYDARQCVSIEAALRAAKTYAELGQTDPTLTWEQQGLGLDAANRNLI